MRLIDIIFIDVGKQPVQKLPKVRHETVLLHCQGGHLQEGTDLAGTSAVIQVIGAVVDVQFEG